MARYVVLEREEAFGRDAAEGARIVRDGFSLPAFLVPPLWFAWHRLWVEAALAFAAMLGLGLLGERAGMGQAAPLLSLLLSLFVGLEGPRLRLAGLARRGWTEVAALEADGLDEAEIRYAAHAVGDDPALSAGQPAGTPPMAGHPPRQSAGPALGLLAYPGQR